MQRREAVDWMWFTYTRVDLLRRLAEQRTQREIADERGVAYTTVRSEVETLKDHLGVSSIREIGRWWNGHKRDWLTWCANLAGLEAADAR